MYCRASSSDFYPRPLRRGRQKTANAPTAQSHFYPRPLRRGRPHGNAGPRIPARYFYPRPLRRGRPTNQSNTLQHRDFYPRPLRRGRPAGAAAAVAEHFDFYPRPLRRGRQDHDTLRQRLLPFLSTPSSQRATAARGSRAAASNFYPRPLRRGRHSPARCGTALRRNFYPRPLRRGRPHIRQFVRQLVHISIHALFAEGDRRILFEHCADGISIHALFAEGDRVRPCWSPSPSDFYPRPLRRGRPARDLRPGQHRTISIHALFAEGDDLNGLFDAGFYYTFLSTPSSQRATQTGSVHVQFRSTFLSTPSSQRATCSINATVYPPHYFYPRPLRRGRLSACAASALVSTFLSTPSSQRATGVCASAAVTVAISIHALFAEGDHPACAWCGRPSRDFYPRPLRRGRPSAPM